MRWWLAFHVGFCGERDVIQFGVTHEYLLDGFRRLIILTRFWGGGTSFFFFFTIQLVCT